MIVYECIYFGILSNRQMNDFEGQIDRVRDWEIYRGDLIIEIKQEIQIPHCTEFPHNI